MRIGVLSDTHIPDRTLDLPAELADVFAGVDLIVHAGDICQPFVIDELQKIAPVLAVRGNRDDEMSWLPWQRVIQAGGQRIGVIHGTQSRLSETADRLRYLAGDHRFIDLRRHLLATFAGQDVQCIIFGHTHQVCCETDSDVLLFNPGGVVPSPGGDPSSIGVLDIGETTLSPRIQHLRCPPRGYTLAEQIRRAMSRGR